MNENHDTHQDQGSFLTGFSIGLFAGAAGYFLFGTNKGQQVRNALDKEWQVAKKKLATDGVIESADSSLRDVLQSFMNLIASKTVVVAPETDKKKNTRKTSGKAAKKFKGV